MKHPIIIILVFLTCLLFVTPAKGSYPMDMSCCTDDSTGTGGEIPGMGWGDTTNTVALNMDQCKADTISCYDLRGRKIKNEPKSFMIRNGKCLTIKK